MTQLETLKTALAGRYAIDREIGRGGMATVFLARDVRHERQVAVKVLDPELGAVLGAERFLAEIKVTANLQHPNLLPLFDSGEASGLLFYVMPFVDGESLRARLDREKQLPVDEALRIATAVANALDYAHSHGVIHRDLKPENILLQAGQPVVADFGIALAVSKAGGTRITQTGLSLGTPQYMSPEQATGDRAVDGRTDIYSLGAMTYEMLTGEPPHVGSTSQAIIAKLMTEEVRPLTVLRRNVPAHVDAAVRHALEKLPADRFASAREFADALAGKGMTTSSVRSQADAAGKRSPRSGVRVRELAAWVVAAVAIAAFALSRSGSEPPPLTLRYSLQLPDSEQIYIGASGNQIAVSPRGDLIAYITAANSGLRLNLASVDQLKSKFLVEGTGIRSVAFSPDGRWVAYTVGSDLRKVSVDGGPPISLGTIERPIFGIAWGIQDSIVMGSSIGLHVISEAGGVARRVNAPDSTSAVRLLYWPLVLPGGDLVVTGGVASSNNSRLAVTSLRTGETRQLDLVGVAPLGIAEDHVIYMTERGTIMAAPFDARRGQLRGAAAPVPLVDNAVVDVSGAPKGSFSPSGALVYVSGRSESVPMMVSAGGASVPILKDPRSYGYPRFSPDGSRIAFSVGSAAAVDIWILDRSKGTLTRLTTKPPNHRAEWSPDGKRVLFRSEQNGQTQILWQPADGSAPAEQLFKVDELINEAVLSPDGEWLVYRTAPGGRHTQDILAVRLKGDRTPVVLASGPGGEVMPRVSPDGKWLAYSSNESGIFEIYVRPFPGAGARVQVSTKGGMEPLWDRSGRTLYFRNGREVVAMPVTTGASFSVGTPRVLFTADYLSDLTHPNWDVAPGGNQFLMLQRAGDEAQVVVVHNWIEELRKRLAPGRR